MGQAQRQYEISEEAARTPEYQELETLARAMVRVVAETE